MRRSRNLVGVLATVGMAGLVAISACKSSDQSQQAPQAPGESRPGLSQPAPQGNMPVAPERSSGDTGGSKGGY
jgi:hypothetical protein